MKIKILPTITTTKKDWPTLLEEASKLGLTEICFFPTILSPEERAETYKWLEQSTIKNIPFVHLKSDMESNELFYLKEKFKTKIFNIHPEVQYPLKHDLSHWYKQMFVETIPVGLPTDEELQKYAGICADVSHLEMMRQNNPNYFQIYCDLMQRYPVGCWHISASRLRDDGTTGAPHHFNTLSEFSYVANYKNIIAPTIALELENSIAEQLEVKDYISSLLTKHQ